ncbi:MULTISPECIES: hypothetical protein [Nocardia]|jgi:hypothetical protein|uniref:Uncharacterized protein n=2 Tax=Nocardia TaxID=1817 RepID=A0A2T2YRA3_9NOCA|nr:MULTISPECIES: hypothetical protein [Nocardia]MBF6449028.1 hypothetical protein [Nocardia elegans]PSR58052.1 hypothetical protein C8259_32095 [Nocardia nova]
MIYSTTLPAQAAGASDVTALAGAYSPAFYSGDTVTDIEIVAPTGYPTIVGSAADNVTITLRQLRAGAVVTTFGSLTTAAGITLSPETPVSIPITTQPILLAGDVIDARVHQNGAGQAIAAGLLVSVYIS